MKKQKSTKTALQKRHLTNTMKQDSKYRLAIVCLILAEIAFYGQSSSAQSKTASKSGRPDSTWTVAERVQRALIDSALLYEDLKPTYYHLKSAYEYQGQEVAELKLQIVSLRMYQTVREKEWQTAIDKEKRKGKRRLWFGRVQGLIAGAIIGAMLIY
ncbi:hypothetical protein [Dyadobacter sandarakinus]|uniref:Uncharacterized protein n=1 Tax=Dyadobacter sandarakinus TaxID=2747268 RepID=A0ABX7I202_9BACT|nr:hypothetical protein [Dyadobacter sandarakinus]QRQ99727.1 hypothetical protein HWI92_01745 [Dyadobacter sandarakinus]